MIPFFTEQPLKGPPVAMGSPEREPPGLLAAPVSSEFARAPLVIFRHSIRLRQDAVRMSAEMDTLCLSSRIQVVDERMFMWDFKDS